MRRLPASATIALSVMIVAVAPMAAARADRAPAQAPTTDVSSPEPVPPSTDSTAPDSTAPDSTTPDSTTRPSVIATTGTASTTLAASPVPTSTPATGTRQLPRRPIGDARAATDHVVNVSTNCTYFCFVPAQTTIAAGDTVTWSNKSGAEHTVKRCDPAGCNGKSGGTGTDTNFGSATIALPAGASFHYTFDQPGTYVYYCTIHGYGLMHGTITVTAATVTTTTPSAISIPTGSVTSSTIPSGPHLASTGGNTGGTLVIALTLVVLGLAAAAAGLRRHRA